MKQPTLDCDPIGDLQLMEGLRAQRGPALDELYRRYSKLVQSIVMQVLHDEADAQEVLQDVFVQLWRRAEAYDFQKGRPEAWIVTLARRRAVDRVRRRTAYRDATTRYEGQCNRRGLTSEGGMTVQNGAVNADLGSFLHGLMGNLPPAQKEIVEMTYFKGMSQREIAAAASLPLGTVKTRLELGLRKLQAMVVENRSKVD